MGNKQGKASKSGTGTSTFDPTSVGHREALAAWHRYNVDVSDVYETVDVLGQGHMGEVTKVCRKEGRGVHNKTTRQTVAEDKNATSTEDSSGTSGKKKSRQKHKKKTGAAHTNKLPPSTAVAVLSSPSSTPKAILKKSKYADVKHLAFDDEEDETEKSHTPRPLRHAKDWKESQKNVAVDGGEDSEEHSNDGASLNESGQSVVDNENTSSKKSSSSIARRVYFQRFYACKTVTTSRVKQGAMDEMLNEIYVMRNLDHPYILQLFEVYQVKRKLWLITELCTGGDLTNRKLDEPQTTVVVEQILRALAYMHKRNIFHRDLKLENIMYENTDSDATIRLIDFGLSQAFDRAQVSRQAIGTAYTLSPEIASGLGSYTDKSDMWAVGVIVWILLAGDFPFVKRVEELEDKTKLNKLIHAKFEFGITWGGRGISKHAKEFCVRCMQKDPASRWTSKQALDYVQNTWIPAMTQQMAELEEIHGDVEEIQKSKKSLDSTIAAKRKVNMDEGCVDETICMEGIKRFCNYGLMKKTILMAMAHTMDRNDAGRLSDIFLAADTKDTGTLDFFELKTAFKQINSSIDDSTMEKIFEGIDQDNSGEIHYAEFLAALSESQGLITMDRLAEAFDRIDTEGKGYISREDLQAILGKDYDRSIVDKMIQEADFKKNGQIDYEELLQLMFADPEHSLDAVGNVNESLLSLEGFKDITVSTRVKSLTPTLEE